MQPADMLILAVVALVLSVIYNVSQAMRLRRIRSEQPAAADLAAEIEDAQRELRELRADLAAERQRSDTLAKQLSEAGRTRSTFLDNMGYYVRTPLNHIIGYSELLMNGIYGEVSEQQRERLATIHRSGSELLSYITDMLELHRLISGGVELKLKPVPVAPLIEKVAEDTRSQLRDTSLALRTDVAPDAGALFGDAQRIEQVLSQLLLNALRFTKQGGVTISARAVQVRNGVSAALELPAIGWLSDGDWVVITVSDTGIGIPSEDQASIFDTFYRVQRDQTSDERGLGLGLAIVKRIVDLHRGTIWVKSAENQGSTFYVALHAPRDGRAGDTQERLSAANSRALQSGQRPV